jgi:hypothetical protein
MKKVIHRGDRYNGMVLMKEKRQEEKDNETFIDCR